MQVSMRSAATATPQVSTARPGLWRTAARLPVPRGATSRGRIFASAAAATRAPAAESRSQVVALPRHAFPTFLSQWQSSVDVAAARSASTPPPTSLAQQADLRPAAPAVYCHGSGFEWGASQQYVDANRHVAPWLSGLSGEQVEQVAHTYCFGVLAAITAAARHMQPTDAAAVMGRLAAEFGPLLSAVAPGGSSLLVAVPCDMLPLLECGVACTQQLAAAANHQDALAAALSGLQLVSHLRFGSKCAGERYTAVSQQCKQAAIAAIDAGAATCEADVVAWYAACARADSCLWLAPFLGNKFAAVVDNLIAARFSSGERALQYTEAWATLVARKRLGQVPAVYERLVEAALAHTLSVEQLEQLQATTRLLPVDMSTNIVVWVQQVQQHRRCRLQTHAAQLQRKMAAVAVRQQRQERRRASATVPLEAAVAALV